MKIFTNKNFIQKLIIAIVCIIMLNFCAVPKVQAGWGGSMMGVVTDFVAAIADVAASLVQFGVTGEWKWAVDDSGTGEPASEDYFARKDNFKYPILQISPELIFANEIQLLDANFIQDVQESDKYVLGLEDDQPLRTLRNIISGWYVTLRTIAIVGLLSVLIYIGIRIIISSTADDKAKYKQRLMDWVVAFCLLFFMHYIMAAVLSVVEKVNTVLSTNVGIYDGIELEPEYYVKYNRGANKPDGSGVDNVTLGSIQDGQLSYDNTLNGHILGETVKINESTSTIYTHEQEGNVTIEYKDSNNKKTITIKTKVGSPATLTVELDLYKLDGVDYVIGGKATSTNVDILPIESINARLNAIKELLRENNMDVSSTGSLDSDIVDTYVGREQSKGIENTKMMRSANGANVRVSSAALDNGSRILYFTNYARLFLNNNSADENVPISIAYLIIYIALIVFTVMFAIRYIKRVIYIAFLTLMAPMVALTYPLDKIKDRKSTSLEYVV